MRRTGRRETGAGWTGWTPVLVAVLWASGLVGGDGRAKGQPATRPDDPVGVAMTRLLERPELAAAIEATGAWQAARDKAASGPTTRPAGAMATTGPAVTPAVVVAEMRQRCPQVFEVTSPQAEAFHSGAFDAAEAHKHVAASLMILQDFKFDLPPTSRALIDLYRADKLSPVEQELLSRLLRVHVEELQHVIQGDHGAGSNGKR